MFTASQLLAHLWGDYILQSDWMATNKTKAFIPAAIHALLYTLPFALIAFVPMKLDVPHLVTAAWGERMWMWDYNIHVPGFSALAVICLTHFLIDRYRLARYVVWAKNWMGGRGNFPVYDNGCITAQMQRVINPRFRDCAATGYPPTSPAWLSVWLLIIADNVLHITINGLALRYL